MGQVLVPILLFKRHRKVESNLGFQLSWAGNGSSWGRSIGWRPQGIKWAWGLCPQVLVVIDPRLLWIVWTFVLGMGEGYGKEERNWWHLATFQSSGWIKWGAWPACSPSGELEYDPGQVTEIQGHMVHEIHGGVCAMHGIAAKLGVGEGETPWKHWSQI